MRAKLALALAGFGLLLCSIQPTIAATTAGVAIVTEIASDLDIRREDLGRRISEAMAAGAVSGSNASELQAAIAQVGTNEVQFRSDGLLSNEESRRLYQAMDKIGSDFDWYTSPKATRVLGFKVVPGPWAPVF